MSWKSRLIMVSLAVVLVTAGGVCAYYGWSQYRQGDLKTRCRAAALGRRWKELAPLAAEWSRWSPANGESWLLRAEAAKGQGDWQSAAQYLKQIPDGDPRVVLGMIELSKLSFAQLNDPLQGVAACERILRNDPEAEGAHQQLISFFAMTLQREQLLKHIRNAIAVEREPREAYVYYFLVDTFRSADGVKLNQQWLQSNPDAEVFQVARVLQMSDRDVGTAEAPTAATRQELPDGMESQPKPALVADLLRKYPHNIELLAYLAEEHLKDGDSAAAARLLAQAPVSAKTDSRFWRIRGWLHELNDELDAAAGDYQQALQMHALDWTTMNRLAIVERRRKNVVAVERLDRLVERAQTLRRGLQKLPAVEMVPPVALRELARFAQDCGDKVIGPILRQRLATAGAQ